MLGKQPETRQAGEYQGRFDNSENEHETSRTKLERLVAPDNQQTVGEREDRKKCHAPELSL